MNWNAKYVACGMVALLLGTAALPSFARKKKAKEVKTAVETPQLPANDRKRFDYFFLEAIRQQNAGNQIGRAHV